MGREDEVPPVPPVADFKSETGNAPSIAQGAADELDWVEGCISTARAGNAIVSDGIATRLNELLRGPLAVRSLPKTELATLAKELLSEAASPRSEEAGSR